VPDFEPLERHLHPDLDTAKIEKDYLESRPSVAVVDNVLSPEGKRSQKSPHAAFAADLNCVSDAANTCVA
jgi:hypothetical protein